MRVLTIVRGRTVRVAHEGCATSSPAIGNHNRAQLTQPIRHSIIIWARVGVANERSLTENS